MKNSVQTTDGAPTLGYVFALTSAVGAGLATVIGKWNLEAIPVLLMNGCIFTTATVALSVGWLPFAGFKKAFVLTRQGWFWVAMFTVTSLLAVWAHWAGVQRMDPTLAAFVNRAEVPIVIVLGVIFLKERFSRWETLGLLLSIVGIVVMNLTLRIEYTTGFWLALLGALLFGMTEFVSKIAVRHVPPVTLAYLRNLFMAPIYWLMFAATGASLEGLDRVWPGVLALGLVGPILGRMMYVLALRRMELSKVAVISQSQPVYVVLIALFVLGQLPSVRETVGGIFLVAGCILMVFACSRRTRNHS
ncbi:MAG: DMT family transporter [candidate division Zixibacteria bacterium]|nr:DMT family transporter [candidate division Zixibacteria bacterium]MDH3938565.1 DMT family transporter [candidate division Zixibacteria bacterium]MDH4034747.1 DMT family transporter [candidate division Zixibacteria bacterium]